MIDWLYNNTNTDKEYIHYNPFFKDAHIQQERKKKQSNANSLKNNIWKIKSNYICMYIILIYLCRRDLKTKNK